MVNKVNKVIEVLGVEKGYEGRGESLLILKGVNFRMKAGKMVAIVGESGSGKSTLLNLIGGLDKPCVGEVFINGVEITGMGESALARHRHRNIGFVFQQHHLLKDFTVYENMMLSVGIYGEWGMEEGKRVNGLLERVGLGDRKGHYPSELSGGELQRAAIVRALVNEPKVLLADEPTGNLDVKNSRIVFDLMVRFVKDLGGSVVMVTHERSLARRCDVVYYLRRGKLSLVG